MCSSVSASSGQRVLQPLQETAAADLALGSKTHISQR
jgi:hypothetical protein